MPVLRPLDLICLASAKTRDTLANIRSTRRFVVNLAGIDMVDKVIPTAIRSGPEVDEFAEAGLEEKPWVLIRPPGIAGGYGWLECELEEEFEGKAHVLIMGKVVRLEVIDDVIHSDGGLAIDKAKPLMMTGSKKGMSFSTLKGISRYEAFSAMFPDKRDPLAAKYEE